MIQSESSPDGYGKQGEVTAQSLWNGPVVTHGQQVTLLRTEASRAFGAKKAGRGSSQGHLMGRGRGKGDGRQAEQEPFWRRFRPAGLLSSPVCPQTLSTLPLRSSLTSLHSDPAKWEARPALSCHECLIPGDTAWHLP